MAFDPARALIYVCDRENARVQVFRLHDGVAVGTFGGAPGPMPADFHVFGVEINDTAIRWYVDNATNTIMTITAPPLCVSEPGFVWGKTMYMPWKPLYGILNTAVNKANANLDWWQNNNATTLVDWVRFWQFVPDEVEVAL